MSFVVAIDGPAAAGKGTISKALAARFNLPHLDTGLLYRAVGALVLTGADPIEAAQTLQFEDLEEMDLRRADVAHAASKVAVIPEVRAALLAFQHQFAANPTGALLDGRDIGTVICPDADVKLFVTASAQARATRRYLELQTRGDDVTAESVLTDVIARDKRDRERAESPLIPAEDAVIIDTTGLTIEQAIAKAAAEVDATRNV